MDQEQVKWIILYVFSGILQPLTVDFLRYTGGIPNQKLLIPLLCNTLGMAAASFLNTWFTSQQKEKDTLHNKISVKVMMAVLLDFMSGLLVMLGLLSVGSATFTLIYSTCTAWTAIISWITGKTMKRQQWLGVAFVTLGLCLNAASLNNDANTSDSTSKLFGALTLLLGTVLHSACFVYAENQLETAGIGAFFLCSLMGRIESLAILAWNMYLYFNYDDKHGPFIQSLVREDATMSGVIFAYLILIAINSLHAIAFFAILDKIGAVFMGLLKGAISVGILLSASFAYCRYEASQCLSEIKVLSMTVIIYGTAIFILAK